MNLPLINAMNKCMSHFKRESLQEDQAETARTQQIAQNAISNLYLSGRASDLPDEELDALRFVLWVEQRERDERHAEYATDEEVPF